MANFSERSAYIKETALSLGFSACGISKATRLSAEEDRLSHWLKNGYHGKMGYMENHFDKRLDPRLLVPGAKSVISLMYNYFPSTELSGKYKISKYSYGVDYHYVVKDKLKLLLNEIRAEYGQVEGRVFVDSAPVLERAWAAQSGLGWIGKHSLLISKQKGSFFFLAELIIDMELSADLPTTDHCGNCTACIDACPTEAIIADRIVDSTKCISYLTIELKDAIPSHFQPQMKNWIFGCDICQDVCPWNRFAKPHSEPEFEPDQRMQALNKEDWKELTEEVFKDVFKSSAIKRAGFSKLRQTLEFTQNEHGEE